MLSCFFNFLPTRALAADGRWPAVPEGKVLKPGMDDERVKDIRKRLTATGESGPENLVSTIFDAELVESVKKSQKHHNLKADGNEMLPKPRKDPHYLKKKNMKKSVCEFSFSLQVNHETFCKAAAQLSL